MASARHGLVIVSCEVVSVILGAPWWQDLDTNIVPVVSLPYFTFLRCQFGPARARHLIDVESCGQITSRYGAPGVVLGVKINHVQECRDQVLYKLLFHATSFRSYNQRKHLAAWHREMPADRPFAHFVVYDRYHSMLHQLPIPATASALETSASPSSLGAIHFCLPKVTLACKHIISFLSLPSGWYTSASTVYFPCETQPPWSAHLPLRRCKGCLRCPYRWNLRG